MTDARLDRILEIADTLVLSDGQDNDCASTGEQIAAALLTGHPEWSGYSHILDAIERLGPDWTNLVIDAHRQGYASPA